MAEGRRAELERNLGALRKRISKACDAAGRDPAELTLIAITKTYPSSDVRILADLGVTDVGENRDQEAREKAEECADLGLRWHFVGQLQSNKARSVVRYAAVVHSVDRRRLVQSLDNAAGEAGRSITCLIQVDLESGSAAGRGGVEPAGVPELADVICSTEHLRLGGVMAVAPNPNATEGRHDAASVAFAQLTKVARTLAADHPGAAMISAGMSGDLEAAVAAGATHLRIGSALLGIRPTLR